MTMLQLNPDVNAFQRKFVNEVRRCDEMERKLSMFLFKYSLKILIYYMLCTGLLKYKSDIYSDLFHCEIIRR